jgi:hypothetical protein
MTFSTHVRRHRRLAAGSSLALAMALGGAGAAVADEAAGPAPAGAPSDAAFALARRPGGRDLELRIWAVTGTSSLAAPSPRPAAG